MSKIIPLSSNFGFGFTSTESVEVTGYRYEKLGIHHNYHFTEQNYDYPAPISAPKNYKFDAFSPNLNKKQGLTVGHLRQLVLAQSLEKIFKNSTFVAMYGASQGVYKYSLDNLNKWLDIANYHATPYYDVLLPRDEEYQPKTQDGENEYTGCKVWEGPNGPLVIQRSNGNLTYAAHDLVFAKYVSPDFYITGEEQKVHFQSLGLGDKHLVMGLVLDEFGKKYKSRTGDAATADDVLEEIKKRLRDTPYVNDVAWNIICYNMLKVQREKGLKCIPGKWCDPDGEGLYITYTAARLHSAMVKSGYYDKPIEKCDLNQSDVNLLGTCNYINYYLNRAIEEFDPCPLTVYLFKLCQQITKVYHQEKIKDGRPGLLYTCQECYKILINSMKLIGMKEVLEV